MGKSARLRQARREMRLKQDTNTYIMDRNWLGLAKLFKQSGQQVLDQNMKPIEFESIEAHAAYLENEFTQSAKANSEFVERLESGEFDDAIAPDKDNL